MILFGKQPISHTSHSLWGSSFIVSCAEVFGLCDENGGIAYYSKLTFIKYTSNYNSLGFFTDLSGFGLISILLKSVVEVSFTLF